MAYNTRVDLCASVVLGKQRLSAGTTVRDIKAINHVARRARQNAEFGDKDVAAAVVHMGLGLAKSAKSSSIDARRWRGGVSVPSFFSPS